MNVYAVTLRNQSVEILQHGKIEERLLNILAADPAGASAAAQAIIDETQAKIRKRMIANVPAPDRINQG